MIKVPIIITPVQLELICYAASYPKYRFIVRLLFELALRRAELINIKIADIDLDQGTVVIEGKGHKQRLLPLTAMQVHQLRIYIRMYKPVTYLFENSDGHHYSGHGIYNIVRQAAQKANLTLHPHALRHSRATALVNSHVGIWHVQQLLGHKHLTTTAVYLHYAVDDLRHAIVQAR